MRFHKNLAFTLAELLIVLGMLGTIGAITLPTLVYNHKAKILEQQFRATYSDMKEIGSRMNHEHGDVGEYARNIGYQKFPKALMQYLPGGGALDENATSANNIHGKMAQIYKNANAPAGPFAFPRSSKSASVFCDNAGIWMDQKGRIYTFNAENQLFCVDINGTAAPNRYNIDIFVFKPMSAKEMAIWAYNDPDPTHVNNYTGSIVPCDGASIMKYGLSNTKPEDKGWAKHSGSAVDFCPFYEPTENIAPLDKNNKGEIIGDKGTSSRGKELTKSNNYWNDYIDYK